MTADPIPLFGRDPEMERIRQMCAEAIEGDKRALALTGPAGIGKTALLRWARHHATEAGFLTTYVRAPAFAGLPPRFPLGELLEGLIGSLRARDTEPPDPLRRVVDTLRGATTAETYPAALPQIAAALEATGEIAPLALFLDDFHWAPRDGTNLLIATLRAIETPLVFITTARARADEQQSPLPEPTADLWIDAHQLSTLTLPDIHSIATRYLGTEISRDAVETLYERSAGLALHALELLRAWKSEGSLELIAGKFFRIEDGVRPTQPLLSTVQARLDPLSEIQLQVVHVLSLLGRDASIHEVAAISARDPHASATILDSLTRLEIVSEERDGLTTRYRLSHPLISESVVHSLTATQQQLTRSAIYRGLRLLEAEHEPVTASELAHHASACLTPPEHVDQVFRAAAEEAMASGSYPEAARWYRELANHYLRSTPEWIEAMSRAASTTANFDPPSAIDLYGHALASSATGTLRVSLLLGRATAHRIAGMFDEALADAHEAESLADSSSRATCSHTVAMLLGITGSIDRAEAMLRELASNVNDTLYPRVLGHLGHVRFLHGDLDTAAIITREALRRSRDRDHAAHMRLNLAWSLSLLGAWDTAGTMVMTGLAEAADKGDLWNKLSFLSIAAKLSAWRGSDDAIEVAVAAFNAARRMGNRGCMVATLDALGLALLEEGRAEEAASTLGTAISLFSEGTERREPSFTYSVAAEAAFALGDIGAARHLIDLARASLSLGACWRWTVERLEAKALTEEGSIMQALGVVEHALSNAIPVRLEKAKLLELSGYLHARVKDHDASIERSRAALAEYRALGASRYAHALESAASDPSPRGRPRSRLPGGLTARETEVLRLVIQGLSSREIASAMTISIATAKKHVENVMHKANATRRMQLVAFARNLGIHEGEFSTSTQAQ